MKGKVQQARSLHGCACVVKAYCRRGKSKEHFEDEVGKKIMLVTAIDKNVGKKLWGVGLSGSAVNNVSVDLQ